MSDAPQTPPPAPTPSGLTDEAASGLAYITIIPAIIFLIVPPYNQKPIIKFHAFQCLGLAVVWIALAFVRLILWHIPLIGWLILPFAWLCYLLIAILWLLAMINAFQGKRFNIPLIAGFAAQAAGL